MSRDAYFQQKSLALFQLNDRWIPRNTMAFHIKEEDLRAASHFHVREHLVEQMNSFMSTDSSKTGLKSLRTLKNGNME